MDQETSPDSKVLLTTRFAHLTPGYVEVALAVPTEKECVELLLDTAEVARPWGEDQLSAAKAVVKSCGLLPLYVKAQSVSPPYRSDELTAIQFHNTNNCYINIGVVIPLTQSEWGGPSKVRGNGRALGVRARPRGHLGDGGDCTTGGGQGCRAWR